MLFRSEGLSGMNIQHFPFDAEQDDLSNLALPEEIHGFVFCPGSINLKPIKMLGLEAFEKDMQVNFLDRKSVV